MSIKTKLFFIFILVIIAGFLWQVGLQMRENQSQNSSLDEKQSEEKVLKGYLSWGHEVRSFTSCGENEEAWILGDSPALENIKSNYNKALGERRSYTKIFAVLEGRFVEPPVDGFGADYSRGFFAEKLLELSPVESCKNDLIILEEPLRGSVIKSPLKIKGVARGSWFFEGDFPVVLTDWDGRIIAESYATAESDWMTENFVSFTAELEFERPEDIGEFSDRGALILKKDNPSGLPEFDDAVEITVYFK